MKIPETSLQALSSFSLPPPTPKRACSQANYSNFIEVDYLSTTTTRQVITKLKGHFARYGIPMQIVTDSGSQFLSREFKDFTRNWGIGHAASSPEHHKSNRKAEAAVKIAKMMMRKALLDGTDQYEALLELRKTPRQDTGVSPAEMMFGRNTRSMLPSVGTKRIRSKRQVTLRRLKRRLAIKSTYDKGARDLKRLTPGQPVYYQHTEGKKCDWRRGTVRTEHSDRSYIIDEKEGIYRRNRVHLRPTTLRASPERTPPPADENAHSPPAHTEKWTESQETTKADMQTRPQRIRKEPHWFKDYEFNFEFLVHFYFFFEALILIRTH